MKWTMVLPPTQTGLEKFRSHLNQLSSFQFSSDLHDKFRAWQSQFYILTAGCNLQVAHLLVNFFTRIEHRFDQLPRDLQHKMHKTLQEILVFCKSLAHHLQEKPTRARAKDIKTWDPPNIPSPPPFLANHAARLLDALDRVVDFESWCNTTKGMLSSLNESDSLALQVWCGKINFQRLPETHTGIEVAWKKFNKFVQSFNNVRLYFGLQPRSVEPEPTKPTRAKGIKSWTLSIPTAPSGFVDQTAALFNLLDKSTFDDEFGLWCIDAKDLLLTLDKKQRSDLQCWCQQINIERLPETHCVIEEEWTSFKKFVEGFNAVRNFFDIAQECGEPPVVITPVRAQNVQPSLPVVQPVDQPIRAKDIKSWHLKLSTFTTPIFARELLRLCETKPDSLVADFSKWCHELKTLLPTLDQKERSALKLWCDETKIELLPETHSEIETTWANLKEFINKFIEVQTFYGYPLLPPVSVQPPVMVQPPVVSVPKRQTRQQKRKAEKQITPKPKSPWDNFNPIKEAPPKRVKGYVWIPIDPELNEPLDKEVFDVE
jgi:hypothetical protein